MSGKIPDSANVAFEAIILSNSHTLFAIFGPARGQIYGKKTKNYKKYMFLDPFGLVTLVNISDLLMPITNPIMA